MQLGGFTQRLGIFVVRLASILEHLPDMLGARRTRFPEFIAPIFQLFDSERRIVRKGFLDARPDGLMLLDGLDIWVLQIRYAKAGACILRTGRASCCGS